MTDQDRARFSAWLESGTSTQKRHAAARLGHQAPARITPRPEIKRMLATLKWGLRNCLYSTTEACGCSGAHCHYLGRVVTLNDCLKCLPMPKDQPARADNGESA